MVNAFSDEKLDLSVSKLSKDFHEDIWCIVERHLPELRKAVSPHRQAQAATLSELQHCISILLFHAASKAQAIGFRPGIRVINTCFKHFMYFSSNITSISPEAALKVIDALDDSLTQMIKHIDPENINEQIAELQTEDSGTRHAIGNLDTLVQDLINKSHKE